MSTQKKAYTKPALSCSQHIELLQQRGLLIDDEVKAAHYLNTIGYYRLSIYFNPFQLSDDLGAKKFKSNASFSGILNLYFFDRQLRLLVSDAIERIEVTLRTAISNVMSISYGPHWYLDSAHFTNPYRHAFFLTEIKNHLNRSQEDFILDYYDKYHLPAHPPSWMVMECLSFGTISKLYADIRYRSARKAIGDILGQYSEVIKSWMKSLTYTRNLCAHHGRLWNRYFINKPSQVQPNNTTTQNYSPFYLQALVITKLLQAIAPNNHWQRKLYQLLEEYSYLPIHHMGFINDWRNDPFWDTPGTIAAN